MKKALFVLLAIAMVFSMVSCDNEPAVEPTPEEKAPARIEFRNNMMGKEAETTGEGNFATKDAMSEDSYIDKDGAIHGTFTAVDNSKFTAWAAGMSGYSYYACYELNIDALTAEEEGSKGTYIFYVKTSSLDGKVTKEYGTSKSRAKCTKIGNSSDDAAKLEIEYYVLDGFYHKVNNTPFDTLPEEFSTMLMGKKPVATITIAKDAEFKEVPTVE